MNGSCARVARSQSPFLSALKMSPKVYASSGFHGSWPTSPGSIHAMARPQTSASGIGCCLGAALPGAIERLRGYCHCRKSRSLREPALIEAFEYAQRRIAFVEHRRDGEIKSLLEQKLAGERSVHDAIGKHQPGRARRKIETRFGGRALIRLIELGRVVK